MDLNVFCVFLKLNVYKWFCMSFLLVNRREMLEASGGLEKLFRAQSSSAGLDSYLPARFGRNLKGGFEGAALLRGQDGAGSFWPA